MNPFKFTIDEESFFKNRNKIIGASELPIILGLSKYCTPLQLYRIKKGIETYNNNAATIWGKRHELNILSSYIEEKTNEETAYQFELDYITHKKIRGAGYTPVTSFFPFTEFHHPNLKWAVAHPDLIDMERKINIEAKSGRKYASVKRNNFDGFNKDEIDGIPLKYYIQCQWQMLCTGINNTTLRALIDTSDEMNFEITSSVKIQEKLIDTASRFKWHLRNNKPPAPINSSDIKSLFPDIKNESTYLIGSQSEYANSLKQRKEFLSKKVKKMQDEIEDINDSLFLMISDKQYLYDENGVKICSQVKYEKQNIIGIEKLKEIDEDLYLKLKEKNAIISHEVRYVR